MSAIIRVASGLTKELIELTTTLPVHTQTNGNEITLYNLKE